jgi:ATP-dependent Lhr-like helicase
MWFGCGKEKAGFCFRQELALFSEGRRETRDGERDPGDAGSAVEGASSLMPHPEGRYSFREILASSGLAAEDLERTLWESAWRGEVFNDSWESVRQGIRRGFKPQLAGEGLGHGRGPIGMEGFSRPQGLFGRESRYPRWKPSEPMIGAWHSARVEPAADPVDEEERIKDRVRQLLERWGVLFRELLDTELSPLRWSKIFRTLRIMELSGEALGGRFFGGVKGLQFASPRAYRHIQAMSERGSTDGGGARTPGSGSGVLPPVYWMNACDPASLCGVRIEGLPARLPARLPSTHLVYRGEELVLVSKKRGRDLRFFVGPEDPSVPRFLEFLRTFLYRGFQPASQVRVERINGLEAEKSPYAGSLLAFGFQRSYKGLCLERRV